MIDAETLEPASPAADSQTEVQNRAVDAIVARGAGGTFAVAGIATALVLALYLAFYFLAYLPRGIVQ